MPLERYPAAHSSAENAPLTNPPSPNLDGNADPEVHTPVKDLGTKIAPTPIASDPTLDAISVVTGTNIDVSPSRDSRSGEGPTPASRLLFDFGRFLEGGALNGVFGIPPGPTSMRTPDHLPEGGKWEVTKLSGGLINVTVRAVCRHGACESWRSVVIKYAPPFVAAIGEDVPFGTFRQVIEYRALSLLGSTPSIATAETEYRVSIPRVLKFFKEERVLVLRDLGECMVPLESWMYPPTTAEFPPSLETCSSVGKRLGSFLAIVHCDATLLSKSQTLTDDGKPWFENPDTKDIVRDEIVGKILPILRPHFGLGADVGAKIAETISRDFDQSFLDSLHPSLSSSPSASVTKLMFSSGDLWTGSLLIGVSSTSSPNFDACAEVEIGFIDWEFAAPARIGQDIAQLSAWLYLLSTSSACSPTWSVFYPEVTGHIDIRPRSSAGLDKRISGFEAVTSHGISVGSRAKLGAGETLGLQSAAGALLDALLRAYARKVKDYPDYAWFVDEEHDQCKFQRERLAVIRSIWVLFGREIIYNAVEAKSRFVGFFAADVDEDEKVKMWQREMIEAGCWYVSMAGQKSDEEFEEIVRKEGVLKRMYTVSIPL